jgi:hypothetical protein
MVTSVEGSVYYIGGKQDQLQDFNTKIFVENENGFYCVETNTSISVSVDQKT